MAAQAGIILERLLLTQTGDHTRAVAVAPLQSLRIGTISGRMCSN